MDWSSLPWLVMKEAAAADVIPSCDRSIRHSYSDSSSRQQHRRVKYSADPLRCVSPTPLKCITELDNTSTFCLPDNSAVNRSIPFAMSTLQDHKNRTTSAVGMLSKTLSVLDSSYLAPIDTTTTPEVQLREISRRKQDISKAKAALERALGTLRTRYHALLLFVQTQQNRMEVSEDIDQFWTELQGDQLLDKAQDTVVTLDTQLIADQNIYTSLVSQLNNEMVTETANLAVTDPARQTDHPSSSANQDSPPYVTPTTPPQEVSQPSFQPIQLRRVELPTFDGDITQFHDFWCRFRTAVHENDTLSLPTKFIYLTNSLKGSASLIIQGYDPSQPDNYHLAINALRRRYDRPQFTHHLFHQKLEQLQTSSSASSKQRDTLCQIQSFILQLNRFEDTTTSLALKKLVKSKFPRDTQLEVNRLEHRSGKTWTLSELLDGLNEVIEEYEKLDDYTGVTSNSEFHINPVSTRSRSPTPEPQYDPRTCCFCYSRNHDSTHCYHYTSSANRRIIARTYRLCLKCLRPGHMSPNCARPNCPRCNGRHHLLLCMHTGRRSRLSSTERGYHDPYRYRSMSRSPSRSRARSPSYERSYSRSLSRSSSYSPRRSYYRSPSPRYRGSDRPERTQHHTVRFRSPVRDNTPPSRSAPKQEPTTEHESPVYIAADSDDEYDELMRHLEQPFGTQVSTALDTSIPSSLMTVEALAVDEKTRDSVPVILLLDTGAQRSFISQDAVSRLHITVRYTTPLTTVTFGAVRTTEQSGMIDVTLLDNRGCSLQLILRTKDKLTVPCLSASLTREDKQALQHHAINVNSLTASHIDPVSRFDHLDIIGITDDPDPQFDQEEDSKILQRFQDT
ncbi:hypothetical protein OSTOST_15451, partial [Ostertagia ostertagi]